MLILILMAISPANAKLQHGERRVYCKSVLNCFPNAL